MITRIVCPRPRNRRSGRGFTVVELLVAVTLIGVVTALALPSYADMVQKRRLTSSAQQLAAFINQGHTEAVRRNRAVTFSYKLTAHDEWCVGAVLGETPCNCAQTNSGALDFCDIDGVGQVMNNATFGNSELVHAIQGNNSFSFDPTRGFLLEPSDKMSMELHTDSRDYKINLIVNESGNVKLCSKDSLHKVPGYPLC